MANRTFYPSLSYGSSRVYGEFCFDTNNTSSPLTTTFDGSDLIASITRSGVGVLVVVLKDTFNKVVALDASLDDSANDGAYATVGTVINEGTSTPIGFTIRLRAATGTLTDYAARRVRVACAFRNGNWGVK